MRAVFLVTGIMAAGKSTVAQALAERLPRSAHVRGDAFRRMIVNGGAAMTPEGEQEALRQLRLRHRIAAMTADLYFAEGFTPVVQDVVLGAELERFAGLVRSRPLLVVVLAPDAATVERRERERPKSGYGAWTVAELDRALRRNTPRLGLWLDTSAQTPAETVDEILARADEARVTTG
ncbi:AAA family ATPase [Nonomuraea sp. NPDC047897]|uniref:AAA family ATPase n=1 Tax=Nonomuraea sp. NPDC047897 TaxID=3364346 RepID=UPI0037168245